LLPIDTLALLEQERGVAIDVPRTTTMDWAPVRAAIAEYGMRNSNCMAIAPTATISNISSCIPGIEPIYKNIYVKSNQSGDFTVVNEYLITELKKRNLWNAQMLSLIKFHDGNISEIADIPQDLKDKFKEVFQIDPRWLIRAAAYRGKWIDQSQSLNIFYAGKSGKEINDIYLYAWDMGLKTTYYLRTMGVSQVEKSTVNTSEHGSTHVRKGMTETAAAEGVSAVAETPVAEPAGQQPLLTPEPVTARHAMGFALETSNAPVAAAAPAPVNAFRGNLSVADAIAQAQTAFKACRLDDPDCEACQ
jgi:ribonucleoside-diphosphate reductase alpha chain